MNSKKAKKLRKAAKIAAEIKFKGEVSEKGLYKLFKKHA